jgi:hypothetical protein
MDALIGGWRLADQHDHLRHPGDVRLRASSTFVVSGIQQVSAATTAADVTRSGELADHHRLLQRFLCRHPDRPEPAVEGAA